MRNGAFLLITTVALGLIACGTFSLSNQGKAYYNEAEGPTGLETAINLANMMAINIRETKSEPQQADMRLSNLNDQFDAFNRALSQMTDEQQSLTGYKHAVSLQQEMVPIINKLDQHKDDDELRALHLNMAYERVSELQTTLHTMIVFAGTDTF